MQRAVGFDKEKRSCNICLTFVCSFINAKWPINQSGMGLRLFCGSVINPVPVLMKNGARPTDGEYIHIALKVITAHNGAAHLPAHHEGRPARRRGPCLKTSTVGTMSPLGSMRAPLAPCEPVPGCTVNIAGRNLQDKGTRQPGSPAGWACDGPRLPEAGIVPRLQGRKPLPACSMIQELCYHSALHRGSEVGVSGSPGQTWSWEGEG